MRWLTLSNRIEFVWLKRSYTFDICLFGLNLSSSEWMVSKVTRIEHFHELLLRSLFFYYYSLSLLFRFVCEHFSPWGFCFRRSLNISNSARWLAVCLLDRARKQFLRFANAEATMPFKWCEATKVTRNIEIALRMLD